jgi:hypothetical protein
MTVLTVVIVPKKGIPVYQCDERRISELLEVAGVAATVATRSDLEIALWCAQSANTSEQDAQDRPTPKLLGQLENSIKKTRMLLGRVTKYAYTSNIGLAAFRAGTDVVRTQFIGKLGEHDIFQTIPEDGMVVFIDIQNLLHAWYDNIKRVPHRKRSNPGKPDKDVIVDLADQFFRRHSSGNSNKFPEFTERFFEAVTGKSISGLDEVTGKLDWQRRKVRRQKRAGSLMAKKSR